MGSFGKLKMSHSMEKLHESRFSTEMIHFWHHKTTEDRNTTVRLHKVAPDSKHKIAKNKAPLT